MKFLWIVGGAGAALEVWAVLRARESRSEIRHTLRGFLLLGEAPEFDSEGLEVMPEQDFLRSASPAEHEVVLAVGSPRSRNRLATTFSDAGFGFATLVRHLKDSGFVLIDCQMPTDHLHSLGARAIARRESSSSAPRTSTRALETITFCAVSSSRSRPGRPR